MHPSTGFAMEKGGGCGNDGILNLQSASSWRGADQMPTQALYLGGDRGGRSPHAYDPGEEDRSTRR